MADILIRDLDDATFDKLRRRAEILQRPVEDVARDMLSRGSRFSAEERRIVAGHIRAMNPQRFADDSTDMIRHDRDTR
ncbi:MAG TPA: hypothetical protein VGD36_09450 [Xanthobacteraceae bacterium]